MGVGRGGIWVRTKVGDGLRLFMVPKRPVNISSVLLEFSFAFLCKHAGMLLFLFQVSLQVLVSEFGSKNVVGVKFVGVGVQVLKCMEEKDECGVQFK